MTARTIILVGPPASGKSAVGETLAGRLKLRLYDTDTMVEERRGRSIADIFATEGEAQFRVYETEALERACAEADAVVATGGGAVLSEDNRRTLKHAGVVVYLRADEETQLQRVADTATRPLLAGDPQTRRAKLKQLNAERAPLYEAVADLTLDTNDLSTDDAVERIAALAAAR